MGTISSGVGLISGINIEDVVNQYMLIESRPRNQLQNRIDGLTERQTAMMKIQALVMSVQIAAANFNQESVFQHKSVTSNDEDVITATAGKFAAEGTYNLTVKRLASNHHFVSRGYSSLGSSIGSGTISFEIGQGQLARATELNFINGQRGFQHGKIRITDASENTADIDLTTALTVQDVIDRINKNSAVKVTASVSGDRLVITDNSGGTGNLIVADIGSGHTAADLGVRNDIAEAAGMVTSNQIIGGDIVKITADTSLIELNDGNGIRGLNALLPSIKFGLTYDPAIEVNLEDTLHETIGDDSKSTTLKSLNRGAGVRLGVFRITDRNGRALEIDLADANLGENATLGQLKTVIESAAQANNMDISVSFNARNNLKITDNSEPLFENDDNSTSDRISHFIIEDLDNGSAAADLGIVADVDGSIMYGDQIWYMDTVGDVVNAVNNHWDNIILGHLVLSIDPAGDGIKVMDNSGPDARVTVEAMNGYQAAEDLGLLELDENSSGRRLIAGLNTVMLRSLNGGSGGDPFAENYESGRITAGGIISLTDREGNTAANIDLTSAFTVQDVLDAINDTGINTTNIRARINDVGNGIILEDTSSTSSGDMIVTDITGALAQNLGIAVNDSVSSVGSGNLQLQYISEAVRLNDLRQGQGIQRGKFTVTDGQGRTGTIDLARDDVNTLADVVQRFEYSGTGIRARINDTGDGLLLYDTSEGENLTSFTIADNDNSTARDLGILGTAEKDADGNYCIDGSYEFKLEVGGGDSIEEIVSKINTAEMGLQASIINDGASYRISFNSRFSGHCGMVYLDAGTTNLTAETLSPGQDAVVFLGSGSNEHPLLLRSSTNTIKDAIKGITLDLNNKSDKPVEIAVEQDLDSITSQIKSFVDAYNGLMDELTKVTKFDSETYERGVLFADHTISAIRSTVQRMVQRTVPGISSSTSRLAHIGVNVAPFGTESGLNAAGETVNYAVAGTPKLEFDEEAFRTAFAENPGAVAELFTRSEVGMGDYIADRLEKLAGNSDSTINNRLDAMQSRQKLYQKRIGYLDDLLESKETRLYNEFYAMEETLAALQSQQNAMLSLINLTNR